MAMKEIAKVGKYRVSVDEKTGICLVSDGSGMSGGVHASIDITGSVRGMKACGYWGKNDRVRRAAGFQFNIDTRVISREADEIATKYCQCDACRELREKGAVAQVLTYTE